jgi:hypothetical protein
MQGGTIDGQCAVCRWTVPPHRVPEFHEPVVCQIWTSALLHRVCVIPGSHPHPDLEHYRGLDQNQTSGENGVRTPSELLEPFGSRRSPWRRGARPAAGCRQTGDNRIRGSSRATAIRGRSGRSGRSPAPAGVTAPAGRRARSRPRPWQCRGHRLGLAPMRGCAGEAGPAACGS